MNDFAQSFQRAVDYLESHLTENIDLAVPARLTGLSVYNFQRVFSALSGLSVGDYIRSRKMSLAAQELKDYPQKLLDLAVKYGYDSQEGFNRAFIRFHGVSPLQAQQDNPALNFMLPLQVHLSLKGGITMEYRIETKAPFSVAGYTTKQNGSNSYQTIPELWKKVMSDPDKKIEGWFGICFNNKDDQFDYMIGDLYNPGKPKIADAEILSFPEQMFAVFPCRGALPEALQNINTRIWQEWLPANGKYTLDGDYNIEAYFENKDGSEDYNEIWVPVKPL